MTSAPTRRSGLNRTVLLAPGEPWHGLRAGRALGATSRLTDEEWLAALRHLLRTLTHPTDEDRAARPDWQEADWRRWRGARRIVLGGGVVAGPRGGLVAHALASGALAVDSLGGAAPLVELAVQPARASLLGLTVDPPVTGPTLLLDLGHTSLKATVATASGALGPTHLVRTPWTPFDLATWPAPHTLLELVAEAASGAAAAQVSDQVMDHGSGHSTAEVASARIAIANYTVGGRLDPDDTYGRLRELDEDPVRLLGATLGLPVTVLVNDGQAAALPYAGPTPTAVISVGTSLGVGFAPAQGGGPDA